jgi:uncharacterized protein YfiM (DUF2279 family)
LALHYTFNFRVFIILFLLLTTRVFCAQDSCQAEIHSGNIFAPDKARHFAGSFMLTVLSAKVAEHHFDLSHRKSKQVGVVLSFSVGLGKELRDAATAGNRFSWKDMAANVSGIVVGLLVLGIQ